MPEFDQTEDDKVIGKLDRLASRALGKQEGRGALALNTAQKCESLGWSKPNARGPTRLIYFLETLNDDVARHVSETLQTHHRFDELPPRFRLVGAEDVSKPERSMAELEIAKVRGEVVSSRGEFYTRARFFRAEASKLLRLRCSHSEDFREVRWHGAEYTFNAAQAKCVQSLWNAWEQDGPPTSQSVLGDLLETTSHSFRLRDTFKPRGGAQHPAWGTMIVGSGAQGFWLSPRVVSPLARSTPQKRQHTPWSVIEIDLGGNSQRPQ